MRPMSGLIDETERAHVASGTSLLIIVAVLETLLMAYIGSLVAVKTVRHSLSVYMITIVHVSWEADFAAR